MDAPQHVIWVELCGYACLLWLDMRDQVTEEHLEEWEAQKFKAAALNDLECDTEAVHRARVIKRQDNKAHANSKEAAAQELLPE